MGKIGNEELLQALRSYSPAEREEVRAAIVRVFGIRMEPAAEPPVAYYVWKPHWDVELVAPGPDKIQTVKAIRMTTGVSLKEAKALVAGAPVLLLESAEREEAQELTERLREVNAVVRMHEA